MLILSISSLTEGSIVEPLHQLISWEEEDMANHQQLVDSIEKKAAAFISIFVNDGACGDDFKENARLCSTEVLLKVLGQLLYSLLSNVSKHKAEILYIVDLLSERRKKKQLSTVLVRFIKNKKGEYILNRRAESDISVYNDIFCWLCKNSFNDLTVFPDLLDCYIVYSSSVDKYRNNFSYNKSYSLILTSGRAVFLEQLTKEGSVNGTILLSAVLGFVEKMDCDFLPKGFNSFFDALRKTESTFGIGVTKRFQKRIVGLVPKAQKINRLSSVLVNLMSQMEKTEYLLKEVFGLYVDGKVESEAFYGFLESLKYNNKNLNSLLLKLCCELLTVKRDYDKVWRVLIVLGLKEEAQTMFC